MALFLVEIQGCEPLTHLGGSVNAGVPVGTSLSLTTRSGVPVDGERTGSYRVVFRQPPSQNRVLPKRLVPLVQTNDMVMWVIWEG